MNAEESVTESTGAVFIPSSPSAKASVRKIKACLDAGIPYSLVGNPGNGKSSLLEAIAHSMGYELITVIGSQLHAVEAAGLPIVVGQDTGAPTTVKALPDWFRRAQEHPKSIIFFDEWLNTPASVQASLLVFIQTGILGTTRMPEDTRVLMAGNPIESGANGQPLTRPMANRLIHGKWNPSPEDWLEGMSVNWNKPASDRLTEERIKIASFIRNPLYTDYLDKGPRDDSEESEAHPSRRSWDNLARVLSQTDPEDSGVRADLIVGTVGAEAFAAFSVWEAGFRLPNLDDVLADPESINWADEEADRIYAILSMAVGATSADNATQVSELFAAVGRFSDRRDIGAGLVTPFIGKLGGVDAKDRMSMIVKLSNVYKDILQAAGMLAKAA